MTKLYLTSPTTGQVDIHYMRSVFLLQAECNKQRIPITLHLHKSSIVTFGRNACTAAFFYIWHKSNVNKPAPNTINARLLTDLGRLLKK